MTDLAHAAPSCPIAAADITHWDMETDVVVVGFGAAGASTAIEAARGGAKVMLFEAASASGGTSALSGGEIVFYGGGSVLYRARLRDNGFVLNGLPFDNIERCLDQIELRQAARAVAG